MTEREDKPTRGCLTRSRRVFDPSRYGAVLFVLLMVGIYVTARLTVWSGAEHAQLRFVENGSVENSYNERQALVALREPLSGSSYETALRLREAGALGMAVSLSVFAMHASSGNAPANCQDLMRDMIARKLVPPGIEIENCGFRSEISDLQFSYHSEPLFFQILTLPKGGAPGPALLLRLPLPPSETNSVVYFESTNPAQFPAPFSTTEQVVASGWRLRHWQGDALPLNETVVRALREQNDWLKSQNQDK